MKSRFTVCLLFFLISASFSVNAQRFGSFNRADSLRGALNEFRTVFDVTFYDLNLTVDPDERFISGYNSIFYKAKNDFRRIQIDLFANMVIDSIIFQQQKLPYKRDGNAVFVDFPSVQDKGSTGALRVYYHGKPVVAERPPWDGGFVWSKDENGKNWIGVACEGIGASLWWPNKDHLSDEPDSMRITCAAPSGLMVVSNGNLRTRQPLQNGYTRYEWFVNYPINNYNVTLNIADYAHFENTYQSKDGEKLALDYYVLTYNEEKAREHFKQVNKMLACFEESYGKYPFWKDGYALVETPYWGMEHQSAIAYGNNYQNNEFNFDFIIVHESGHEYWGNSVSTNDHAEMWIHESFTTYAEALYLECRDNYETAIEYLMTQKPKIQNQLPILGPLQVNYSGWEDADMYYKGTWMLHSMRNTIDDDALWKATIKSLYQEFELSHPATNDIINFMVTKTGYDLAPIFDLFLNYTVVPKLEYNIKKEGRKKYILEYRWDTPVAGFNMGMKFKTNGTEYIKIYPTAEWQKVMIEDPKSLAFADELFYFKAEEVK